MSIRATCPACGTTGDVVAFFAEDEAKALAAGFAELEPALGRAVLAYLRLFKPPKQQLRISRARAIVDDLLGMVETGSVCKDERTDLRRPAPPWVWVEAIERVLGTTKLDLPLTNNHYLRSVAHGVAGEPRPHRPTKAASASESPIPGVRPSGISPLREPDPISERVEWLRQQLRYKAITQDEFDSKMAELR